MKKYLTEYWIGNERYSSHVFAKSFEHAENICRIRNIAEIISGVLDETEIEKPNNKKELLHEVCFLSFIALKSGLTTPEETIGDKGILHELIHQVSLSSDVKDEIMKNKIQWLRELVIGYQPL